MHDDLIDKTATELLSLISKREIGSEDIVKASLERINKFDDKVLAWEWVDNDLAISQARNVDTKLQAGNEVGSLSGIPIGVKDIFNTADMPTQMGSPIWKNFQPGNDARVVYNLRIEDGIILGKTVTAEFAVHTPGKTINPFNKEYMAGTSSTGSAVAVASRMCPVSLGTQTGGSIIRPASYAGVFGYKPSFGLVPRTAMLKTTDTLDTVGYFARCHEDLLLLFNKTRVHGLDYPVSHNALSDTNRQQIKNRPWRVALIHGPKWDDAEPYAQKAVREFAEKCKNHPEIELQEVIGPESLIDAHQTHLTIYDKSLAYYFNEEFKNHTLISEVMYEIVERGNGINFQQYKDAQDRQVKIAKDMDDFLSKDFDIVIDLSTGGEARQGILSDDRPDNCLIWTLCWLPTISIPMFYGPNKLPFGMQVISRRYSDYLLFNFMKKLDEWGLIGDVPYPKLSNL